MRPKQRCRRIYRPARHSPEGEKNNMLRKLRILWVAPVVVLLIVGSNHALTSARNATLGNDITERSLQAWWYVIASTYLFLFICSSVFVLLFFRILRRCVPPYIKVFCFMGAFVIWVLLALATIASDPVTVSALSSIGLKRMHYFLWTAGMVLWIPYLYALFRTVDASPQTQISASNSA